MSTGLALTEAAEFAGKRVLVTGGTKGIGARWCHALSREARRS